MALTKSNFNYSFPAGDYQWQNGELVSDGWIPPSCNIYKVNLKRVIFNNQNRIFAPFERSEGVDLYRETISVTQYYFADKSITFDDTYRDPNAASIQIVCSQRLRAITDGNGQGITTFAGTTVNFRLIISIPSGNIDEGKIQMDVTLMALGCFIKKFPAEELLLNYPALERLESETDGQLLARQMAYWPAITLSGDVETKISLANAFVDSNKVIGEIIFSYTTGSNYKNQAIP